MAAVLWVVTEVGVKKGKRVEDKRAMVENWRIKVDVDGKEDESKKIWAKDFTI